MLVVLFVSSSSYKHGKLLRAGASLLTCSAPSLELVLIALLTILPSSAPEYIEVLDFYPLMIRNGEYIRMSCSCLRKLIFP